MIEIKIKNRFLIIFNRLSIGIVFFIVFANELLDVTAYGLRSDFLSPEMMPKATVELALTKNRKLLLASVLGTGIFFIYLIKIIINLG